MRSRPGIARVRATAQVWVGVDPGAFPPNVGDCAFGWPPVAFRLDVAVVGGQVDREPVAEQPIQKARHEPFAGPLPNLVVHARRAQLHAVHDLVHLVDDEAKRVGVITREDLVDTVEGTVSQSLGVADGSRRHTLVYPELAPR